MDKKYENIMVYEHVYGIPSHLDTVDDELTECVYEYAYYNKCTVEEVENFLEEINKQIPTDQYGRKVNRYLVW